MKVLAFLYSDKGIMDTVYGPEGQMWNKKENGEYDLMIDWYKEYEKDPEKNI